MVHEIREKNLLQIIKNSAREVGYKTLGAYALMAVLVIAIGITFLSAQSRQSIVQQAAEGDVWAFEETYDGLNPAAPSQDLLPRTFDYSVTHRNHPAHPEGPFGEDEDHWSEYPADHGMDCSPPPTQHPVEYTTHTSNRNSPDKSFFICRNHMMSSMGDVDGYSVTNFWPLQEFDFSQGTGVLEFDVNINVNPARSWREILIAPRDQMKIAPAEDWLPIDETYPKDRIVFTLSDHSKRSIKVGTGVIAPDGWIAEENDWRDGDWAFPGDPALTDRAIRRKNRITITNNKITWSIMKQDGTFDDVSVDVPQGMPFKRGLVMFKTHAYTPQKDGNTNIYTYHWDNIRFNGPKLPPYEVFELADILNLEGNGSVPVGTTETVSIDLPKIGPNPAVFAQIHQPQKGQVLLSINGNPNIDITNGMNLNDNCNASGWTSTRIPIDPALLKVGSNSLKWTIGPRASCVASWTWDGYAVKDFEIQFDGTSVGGGTTSTPTPTQPPSNPTPTSAQVTPTPTPLPKLSVLSINPATGSFITGQTFTSEVRLNTNGQSVNGVETTVNYPTSLQVVSVANGTSFDVEAEKTLTTGKVVLAYGATTPKTGTHTIATITFKVMNSGSAAVTLTNSAVAESNLNTDVFKSSTNATYTLTLPTPTPSPTPTATPTPTPTPTPVGKQGDLNRDSKIDIQDLSYLLTKWGTNDTLADFNKDGKVNTFDLSVLLSNWGK